MTKTQADRLRDVIRADRIKCEVVNPTPFGARTHVVRVPFTNGKRQDFRSERGYRAWKKKRAEDSAALQRFAVEHGLIPPRPRSPLDMMIDKACGLG